MPVPVHAELLHWRANDQQTKPCRLLGGFSGEAGEITIVTGDEELASESPVGKRQLPERGSKLQDAESHPSNRGGERERAREEANMAASLCTLDTQSLKQ